MFTEVGAYMKLVLDSRWAVADVFLRCLSFEMCLFWEENSCRIPNMSSDCQTETFDSFLAKFTSPKKPPRVDNIQISMKCFKLCQDTGKIATSTQSALRLSGWCFLKAGEFRSKIPKFLWLLRLAQDVWSCEVRTEGAEVKSSKLTKWWWVEKFVLFFFFKALVFSIILLEKSKDRNKVSNREPLVSQKLFQKLSFP